MRHQGYISQQRKHLWVCRCDCGTEKVVRGNDLMKPDVLGQVASVLAEKIAS